MASRGIAPQFPVLCADTCARESLSASLLQRSATGVRTQPGDKGRVQAAFVHQPRQPLHKRSDFRAGMPREPLVRPKHRP